MILISTHDLFFRFKDSKQYINACATCCDVSSCGNFAVIGYSTGHVDTFNMQSGLHRGTYGSPGLFSTVLFVMSHVFNNFSIVENPFNTRID